MSKYFNYIYIYIYIAKKDEKLEHDKGEMFA